MAYVPILIVLLLTGALVWIVIRSRKNEKIIIDQDGKEVRCGLGGWLILVGLGVVFSPLRLLAVILPMYFSIFNDGTYDVLTTPGTDAYHPFWSVYIWGEISLNSVIFIGGVYLVYLFFSKKTLFPKFYIWLAVGTLMFIIIDAMLIKIVLPNEVIFDPDTIKEIVRTVLIIVVWVPYMLLSRRVKATFVN